VLFSIWFKTNHVQTHKSTPLLSIFSNCSEPKTWFEIALFLTSQTTLEPITSTCDHWWVDFWAGASEWRQG